MEKTVIVINGHGGCGKDTLCDMAAEAYRVTNVSSITPIKELAKAAGWNGEKDPKSRKMLADLKQIFTDYNDLCTTYIVSELQKFLDGENTIMFVHIREASEIEKFVKKAMLFPCHVRTLLVERRTGDYSNEALGNASDDNVKDYNYDYTYINDAESLPALKNDFLAFLGKII